MPTFWRMPAPKFVINWSRRATHKMVSFLMDEIRFLYRWASTSGVETKHVGKRSFASAWNFFHFFSSVAALWRLWKNRGNGDKAKILPVMLVCWAFAPQSTPPLQPPARCNCGGNPQEDESSQTPKFAHLSHPSVSWQPQLTALLCGAFFDVCLAFEIAARKTCTYVLY